MKTLTLKELGYTDTLAQYRADHKLDSLIVGRVISEHKERYVVKTDTAEYDAELIGNIRYSAESRYDFPAVGDWVAMLEYDVDKALIHAVFPRHSILERQAVGRVSQKQIIATNIDYGLIVQSVNRDFNLNRLERYLTICYGAKVEPIIILNKIDLIEEEKLAQLLDQIQSRIKEVPVIAMSNQSLQGLDALTSWIQTGKTYCLLGSSGVGKSTLLNNLLGKKWMQTTEINQQIDRGKHTTTHRELIVLEKGGIMIDNPGMREVGTTDASMGLELTFDLITELSQACKYKDCTHTTESGCAILEAVEKGQLTEDSYYNYQKLQREKAHFEASVVEKRRKDKEMGKLYKRVKKERKRKKY
ncbi:MAG: ribosome small subunit-dependent GTPase A [Bacteroidota bacterium]